MNLIFINFHSKVQCLKIVLSKGLGIGIILGSMMGEYVQLHFKKKKSSLFFIKWVDILFKIVRLIRNSVQYQCHVKSCGQVFQSGKAKLLFLFEDISQHPSRSLHLK